MMLPIVMEYNADCTGEKYKEIARAMGVKGVDDMSVEEYRKALDVVFGEGSCHVLKVRKYGGMKVIA